jgi:hypothetical protein
MAGVRAAVRRGWGKFAAPGRDGGTNSGAEGLRAAVGVRGCGLEAVGAGLAVACVADSENPERHGWAMTCGAWGIGGAALFGVRESNDGA